MKLLVFAPYGIGNLLLLHPILKALHSKNIQFDIVSFLGTVDSMLKNWDEFTGLYNKKWSLTGSKKEILSTISKIRRERYDISILSFPSAKPHYNILSFLCGAKIRIGSRYSDDSIKTLGFLNSIRVNVPTDTHDVIQNLFLFQAGGVKLDKSDLSPTSLTQSFENVIGIHPGCSAGGVHKRWPLEKWNSLISSLQSNYPDYIVRIFFGPDEQEELEYFSNNESVDKITGLFLVELKRKIAESSIFVSNDSGLMHIASFMGIPTVAINGPSDETRTGPYSTKSMVVTGECEYRPCAHSYTLQSHHFHCHFDTRKCLDSISIDTVVSAVDNLIR